MPFYFRKSVSVGPFRFNLSQGGIGVSAGVRGFRVGTGPRGHYVHAGLGGLYYRSSIPAGDSDRKRSHFSHSRQPTSSPGQAPTYLEPNIDMRRVSSADVLEMVDARFSDLLSELTEKQNSVSSAVIFGSIGAAATFFAAISLGVAGFIAGLIFSSLAIIAGVWRDSTNRTSVIMYDLESDALAAYESVTMAFDALVACVGKWHVDAGGAVRDIHTWKRNAGASHIVDKRPTIFDYSLPRVVASNVTPPVMKSGKETLYFFPDFLLVVDKNKIGAVGYDMLNIRWQDSNFIEDGNVPSDTKILGHVWKHPNKRGGPDRRFANNYQIPLCLYESIHLTSTNGLNELLQVSRTGITRPFAAALATLSRSNGSASLREHIPQLNHRP